MPLNISPEPAVAIPGFPVAVRYVFVPSEVHAGTLFRCTMHCISLAICVILLSGNCSISALSIPVMREHSPACGVITQLDGKYMISLGIASASSITGIDRFNFNNSLKICCPARTPSPGPQTIAFVLGSDSITFCIKSPTFIPPSSSIGIKDRRDSGGNAGCMIGVMISTRPTPIRNADIALNAGAPDISREPAMINTLP